jgi:hypothetical protein
MTRQPFGVALCSCSLRIGLEESLLGQFFRVRPRASPPVGDPEEEPPVLPYPIVEHLVSDLHRKPSFGCAALLSPIECVLPSVLFQYPLLFLVNILLKD